ncbi:hypothetical protein [Xanthomonas tesorieronis]|uniref:hypothetical protein n=1 Tax=Xanthomonas tesorieronis TaxID=3160839 RepID=UPI0035174349
MNIPLTADELIDELARVYPEVVFDPELPREEFLLKSGERRLILRLLAAREQEHEDARGGR